ncbi:hypothetical protein [Pseudomonas inefficax]|uniref:hypothetical protein n=1 Tax=Pseudomonas inefficax TaxID=2078786 RepID=UPI00404692A7
MDTKKTLEQGFETALGGFNELQNKFLNEALDQYSVLIKQSISTDAGVITTQSLDVQQGYAAEAHHTGSYNIEAAGKGANNHRATMDVGRRHDPVTDIRINTPNGSKDYQLKFYQDGKESATAFNHGKYEDVGKIVPADQLEEARTTAKNRADTNAQSRPEVSKNYKNTAEKLDDSIHSDDRPDIKSKPLKRRGDGSSEELVKETKKEGTGPEYADKDRVRNEFNRMQYGNAAKSGAISGAALSTASELLGFLRSDEPLTMEQCYEAAERIVVSSLKGAGSAVFVTGIQHLGQSLIDNASHSVLKSAGGHLIKGNVASAVANIALNLGQNLYKFSPGEIDSLEFGGSMISTTVTIVGGSMAYSAGAATATFLGQWVASEIASTTLLGTTLGALGPIALGTVFSIGFSFAVSAYVGYFAGQGKKLAMEDLQSAMAELNGGSINLTQYAGLVGTMSDFKFEWKDMLPFSGSITVFAEYRTRKSQLMDVQKRLEEQIAKLPSQEAEALFQLKAGYQQKLLMIERDYELQRQEITRQAGERYQMLGKDLNAHLELQFLMFTPIRNTLTTERKELRAAGLQQDLEQARIDAYQHELETLQQSFEQIAKEEGDTDKLTRTMLATIDTRLEGVLPKRTSWDQAYEFFVPQ